MTSPMPREDIDDSEFDDSSSNGRRSTCPGKLERTGEEGEEEGDMKIGEEGATSTGNVRVRMAGPTGRAK